MKNLVLFDHLQNVEALPKGKNWNKHFPCLEFCNIRFSMEKDHGFQSVLHELFVKNQK